MCIDGLQLVGRKAGTAGIVRGGIPDGGRTQLKGRGGFGNAMFLGIK